MNTISSTTQSQANYEAAANDVLAVLDDFNFYTDTKFDPAALKSSIVAAIRKNVEANVDVTNSTGPR
jgi:hypothetical protein